MSQPITRMVRFMSMIHETSTAVKTGKVSLSELSRATVLSQRHFPKFLVFTMASSGFIGYYSMEYIRYMQTKNEFKFDPMRNGEQVAKHETISQNEAMLIAMIEDSASKSWRENVNDALHAQDLFMVGDSKGREEPEFMKRIRVRSEELIRRNTRDMQG